MTMLNRNAIRGDVKKSGSFGWWGRWSYDNRFHYRLYRVSNKRRPFFKIEKYFWSIWTKNILAIGRLIWETLVDKQTTLAHIPERKIKIKPVGLVQTPVLYMQKCKNVCTTGAYIAPVFAFILFFSQGYLTTWLRETSAKKFAPVQKFLHWCL